MSLARNLEGAGWTVTLLDRDPDQVRRAEDEGFEAKQLTDLSDASVDAVLSADVDAVVAMSGSDDDDVRLVERAIEAHGVQRAVARLDDLSHAGDLRDLGAMVVDHSSAMVNLLEQAVRAPQSAKLVLHADPNREAVQITVTNRSVIGREIRQLRLPQDVLVVAVERRGQSIVPNGFTRLRRNDELSLVGSPESLAEVTMRIGF